MLPVQVTGSCPTTFAVIAFDRQRISVAKIVAEHGDRLPKISTVADKHSCDLTGILIHNSHLLVVNRATGRRRGATGREENVEIWKVSKVGGIADSFDFTTGYRKNK